MGLDLWFREDVARILASTQEAMRAVMAATPPLDPELAESYQRGFADAVQAVGIAFGVAAPGDPGAQVRLRTAPYLEGDGWRREPALRGRTSRSAIWPE